MPFGFFGGVGRPPRRDREERRHREGGLFSGVRFFHGPMRFIFFGRPIFLSTGRQVGFLCGIIAFFVMLISSIAVCSNLGYDKKDREYYKELISSYELVENALLEEPGYAFATGNVKFYDKKSQKLHYSVNIDGKNYNVETKARFDYNSYNYGSSKEIYTLCDDINYYQIYGEVLDNYLTAPGEIEIAYTMENGNLVVAEFVIDLIYCNYEGLLQKTVENLNATIKTETVAVVILIIIDVAIIALIVLGIVKTLKKSKEKEELEKQKLQAEVQEAEAKAQEAQTQADMKNRYCLYCGVKFADNDTKCPNCGSSHFEVRK